MEKQGAARDGVPHSISFHDSSRDLFFSFFFYTLVCERREDGEREPSGGEGNPGLQLSVQEENVENLIWKEIFCSFFILL